MQMICINTGKMAEDDVTDVVLAAVAFIEMFGVIPTTTTNITPHMWSVLDVRCRL